MKKSIKMLSIVPISLLFAIISLFDMGHINHKEKRLYIPKAELKITEKFNGEQPPVWLEDYVIGVVASEMPISFNMEALKAQAVASRTYGYRAYCNNKAVSFNEIGQAYTDINSLKKKWGSNFEKNYFIVKNAVTETKGEILVYENQPILAVFSSASGGMTESSENMWGSSLPYLKSVKSQGDEKAEVFYGHKEISLKDASALLGVKSINSKNTYIISKSNAEYVSKALIGGRELSGSKIRTLLGLKSENFTMCIRDNKLVFNTKGYGHGVGMSQYGAEYMAQAGYNYKDILTYYYSNVKIIEMGRD